MDTRSKSIARYLAALVAAFVVLLVTGSTVRADAQEPGASARSTWSIQPATPVGPDERPRFDFAVPAGTTVSDVVMITNLGATALDLDVYAKDAFTTRTGGFDLQKRAAASRDMGAWVTVGVPSARVQPGEQLMVPFTITVPPDATPGDHVGGIVATSSDTVTDARGGRITVERRVGTRIYLRVDGELRPRVSVERLEVSYDGALSGGGTVDARYVVRNTGNTRIRGSQRATVTGPLGITHADAEVAELPELLPGASVQRTARIDGVVAAGPLDVSIRVDPRVPDHLEASVASAEATTGLWTTPWLVVLLVVVLASATAIVVLRRRRHRSSAVEG